MLRTSQILKKQILIPREIGAIFNHAVFDDKNIAKVQRRNDMIYNRAHEICDQLNQVFFDSSLTKPYADFFQKNLTHEIILIIFVKNQFHALT